MKARERLIEVLGGKCAVCQMRDSEMLQIDHIADDGLKDLERFKSNAAMYTYYASHPDDALEHLQILCANHNWKKRYQRHVNSFNERKPIEEPVKLTPLYFGKIEIEGVPWTVWKGDPDRVPPAFINCANGCDHASWRMLGDQEDHRKTYLQCLNCGYDTMIQVLPR